MLRLLMLPLLLFAAVLAPALAPAQPTAPRIVAVGDLHGDHDAWLAIAQAAKLIDRKGRWAGGNATLVQLGDVVDRGPDSLKIIHDLMRLQREAPKRGGKVVVLVGNHEAMMMIGDLRYVSPGEFAAFAGAKSKALRDRVYETNRTAAEAAARLRDPKVTPAAVKAEWLAKVPLGMIEYQLAWRPDGELGKWAVSNPAVAKIGDTLFVHGGISATYALLSIEEINRRTAAALKAQDKAVTAIISDPVGPLWYRGLIMRGGGDEATVAPIPAGATAPLAIDQELALALRNFGVKRMVVGHTPSTKGIVSDANGQLWRADSAISRAYGGKLTYLEIVGDRVKAHEVPRPPGQPWGETP